MTKSFELYIGSGIRQKAASLVRQCLDTEQAPGAQTLVFVVPTHRYALEIMRRHREESPETWRSPAIHPLDRFLRLFLSPDDSGKKILTDEESFFILRWIVAKNPGQFAPIFSRGGEPFPNLIQSALRLIRELKTSGMTPHRLKTLLKDNREGDLIRELYLSYEKVLKQHGFLDKGDIIPCALNNLSEASIRKNLPGIQILILDGIDIFPRILISFLKKIGGMVPKTIVLLEYEDQRAPIFKHMEESYRDLSSCASRVILVNEEIPPSPKTGFLQSLYKTGDETNLPFEGAADFMEIYSLPDRLREVTFIAQSIKRSIVQEKIRPRDICVCLPALDVYAPLAGEIFDSYGIPHNLSLGLSLSQVPVIRAIDQFLSLMEAGFERSVLLQFTMNPYFSLDAFSNDKNPPSTESMIKHLKSMRVNEGGGAWIEAFRRSMESLSRKISLMEKGEMPIEDETPLEELLKEAEKALGEQAYIIKILGNLTDIKSSLDGEHPFSFYSKTIKDCIENLRTRENLMFPPYEGAHFGIFHRDIKALEQLFEIMDCLDILSDSLGDDSATFPKYVGELRNILNRTDFYAREAKADAVQILGRLEPRLFSFRLFFLGGFLEGEFPHAPAPFLFLKTGERKQLGLSTNQETLAADRFLFYHFMRQTKERFIITFPFQKDETPLLPSPMLEEILRVSGLSPVIPEPDENPYCEHELQIKIGGQAGRGKPSEKWRDIYELYAKKAIPLCPPERCYEIMKKTGKDGAPDIQVPQDHPVLNKQYFSTSQLEEYGRCPFHYYAQRILHLREPEEMEEEMSPLERGELIHRALFRFYRRRASSGSIPIRTEEEALEAARDLIELAREEMEKLPYRDLFWEAERERILGGDHPLERPGLLRIFINRELQFYRDNDPGYLPEFFEVAFGKVPGTKAEHDPLSSKTYFRINHPGGAIHIRGKVDRVEISGNLFAVVDYKTGSTLSTIHELEAGTSLQLPVYLMAIKEKLKTLYRREFIPAGGIFYQINREDRVKRDSQIILKSQRKQLLGSERKKLFCEDEKDMERQLETAKSHVKNHVTGIRKGLFPLSPLKADKALCRVCSFRLSCRRRFGRMFRRR